MVDQIIHSDPCTIAQAISLVESDAKGSIDVFMLSFSELAMHIKDEVVRMIDEHRSFFQTSNAFVEKHKIQLMQRICEIVNEQWHFDFWNSRHTAYLADQIEQVFFRSLSPHDVARELIHFLNNHKVGVDL